MLLTLRRAQSRLLPTLSPKRKLVILGKRLSLRKSDSLPKRAAHDSLQATIDNSRLDQRAWVGVTGFDMAQPVAIGSILGAQVAIANSGKTPALHVRTHIVTRFLDKATEFVPDNHVTGEFSEIVIQPGAKVTLPSKLSPGKYENPAKLRQDDLTLMASGEYVFWVGGVITYQDVFGKRHETAFCGFLSPDLKSFSGCKAYNKAN
jgi:hypothetical protein